MVKQSRNISIAQRVRNAITAHHTNDTRADGLSVRVPACAPPSRFCHAASGPGPARQGDRQARNKHPFIAGHRISSQSHGLDPGRSHDLDEAVQRADGRKMLFSRPLRSAPANIRAGPIWRRNGNSGMVELGSAGTLLPGRMPRRSGEKRAPWRRRRLCAPRICAPRICARGRRAVALVGGVPI